MPLIQKKVDPNIYSLGLWQVEEHFDTLFSMVKLGNDDCSVLNGFQNPARKIEWLSVRVLLRELLNNDTGIHYNGNRKPYLCDKSQNISISHSHKLTSVLLSKKHRVGIDLEHMTHRIAKIAHKFINEKEYITPDMELEYYHLYIHWCAKEALYKICDKVGLNFKTSILIDPFEPEEKGEISGNVNRDGHIEYFNLNYFKFDNYIVVWCIK